MVAYKRLSSFNLEFFRYARFSLSEEISLQYKWGCEHEKEPLFRKFYLRGGHCFTERDYLEVQIVVSSLVFEILENGFQFSAPLIALF